MKKYNVMNDEQEENASKQDTLMTKTNEQQNNNVAMDEDEKEAIQEVSSYDAGYEDFEDTLQAKRSMAKEPQPEADISDEEVEESHERNKENGFGAFFVEVIQNIKSGIQKHSRAVFFAGGLTAVVLIVIFVVLGTLGSKGSRDLTESLSNNETMQESQTSSTGLIAVPDEPLQQDAYPEVNNLVSRYFAARQNNDTETLKSIRNFSSIDLLKIDELSQYVEEYQNITCYTKKGPFDGSYIVYACYDVKIKNWEAVAPSELTLLVCTNEDGELYIYSGDMDQNVADYIVNISSQDDVVDLITRVNAQYSEVMSSNPDFATYIEAMNQTIKDSVGEQLAVAEMVVSENEAAAEDNVSENAVSDNEVPQENVPQEVKASTTVNVRASDSEQADKLGKVEAGTVLVCKEQKRNGWTEVVYNGQSGYIKSEYLTVVGEENTDALPQTNGKVTAKDTVNIRSSADVNGSKIGIAYAGETFDLIKKESEWTTILYNGQVAYVKTEYIE